MSRAQDLRENAFNKSYFEQKIEVQNKLALKQNLFTIVGKPTNGVIAKKYYNWALALLEGATYSHVHPKQDVTVVFQQYLIDRIKVNVSPISDSEIFNEYVEIFRVGNGCTKEKFNITAFDIMKTMFDNEEGFLVDISKVNINNGTPFYNPLDISFLWRVTVTMHYA